MLRTPHGPREDPLVHFMFHPLEDVELSTLHPAGRWAPGEHSELLTIWHKGRSSSPAENSGI
jgi:hypothetical protein